MATKYWIADDDVAEMAWSIVEEHHPRLHDATILFLFRETAQETGGQVVLGKASLCSAKEQAILGKACAFKIELAWDYWQSGDDAFRRALLDHELCHCIVRKDAWAIKGHDIEEFACIVERHGAWKADVGDFFRRTRQLELFEGDAAEKAAAEFVGAMRSAVADGLEAVEIVANGKGVRVTETGVDRIG